MRMSDSIKEIAAAFAKFQAEVNNPKNTAKNPQFGSKYAPLDVVI
ncbi:ERF family protein, partial [Bacillus cereus]